MAKKLKMEKLMDNEVKKGNNQDMIASKLGESYFNRNAERTDNLELAKDFSECECNQAFQNPKWKEFCKIGARRKKSDKMIEQHFK